MDAVIFDMDGVVVDSERYWVPMQNEHLLPRTTGVDVASADEITGMASDDVYRYLDAEYGTQVTESEFLALFDDLAVRVYGEKVALIDGFESLVGALRERGSGIGLASSARTDWIGIVLERFDIRDEFDVVVSAEDIAEEGKPKPGIYFHTIRSLSVLPEECVVVEDSSPGVRAAKAAETYCIGFENSSAGNQDLSAADTTVRNPAELRTRLLSLCSSRS
jgi:HAD superfamily hydrolase (TIGR01509 family)